DLISWLLEFAEGEERTTSALASRVLLVNFPALLPASSTLTSALYDLAAYPEHIDPMREEVQHAITEDRWTKAAIGKINKADSFLRESQRPVALSLEVVAPEGFTFTDSTMIPYGSYVSTSGMAIYYDEDNYALASQFDGFRFAHLRDERSRDEHSAFNYHIVSTSEEYLSFGHGRHACPGWHVSQPMIPYSLGHLCGVLAWVLHRPHLSPLRPCSFVATS
ncbi:cytochrome P450, partial [Mycena albidolilacea]